MIKPFLGLVTVLFLCAGGVALHYLVYGKHTQEAAKQIVKITKLPSPSLSVAYYEPRVLFYENAANPAYPQMQVINRMDLVYAK